MRTAMWRTVTIVVEVAVLALVAYNNLVALPGWRNPRPARVRGRRQRFRVVVPAHDEQQVVDGVLRDLAAQDHDRELVATWVIADRCADATAEVARRWAQVAERSAGPDGKGAALSWYLDRHPLEEGEALVVLDADNRVPPDLLSRFADALGAGGEAVQAYLDVVNPDASPLATASALTYWAGNRMVQLARENLGWSADLGGTGMCLTARALEVAGGFGSSLTEDQDLLARLHLAGVRVRWLHDVRIRDEKPAHLGVTVRQRARWMAGRRGVAREHAGRLVGRALRERDPSSLDLAIRLVQPGRSFVALASALLALLAWGPARGWLLPWPLWAAVAALQVLAPLAFLARERVPARYLVRYPLVTLLALLWLPIRLVSRGAGAAWSHTPHGAGRGPGQGRAAGRRTGRRRRRGA